MVRRIVVLNPKGGSGKTTVAINLAAYYATQGLLPTLMDFDPQASSTRWLRKRQSQQPPIHGIAAKGICPELAEQGFLCQLHCLIRCLL